MIYDDITTDDDDDDDDDEDMINVKSGVTNDHSSATITQPDASESWRSQGSGREILFIIIMII